MNAVSISISPAMRVVGKRYFDLPGIIELMTKLWREEIVDGFELQNLAEWDRRCPPRDERDKRMRSWEVSPKYTVDEIADRLAGLELPILSVHANRDAGICLCSGETAEIEKGKTLVRETLYLAERLGAQVCIFHLWDTWKEAFDPGTLWAVYEELAAEHPAVNAAVENVPTQLVGHTPYDLVSPFRWITLDLRWAGLYDELGRFEAIRKKIANVHLRGRLAGGEWELPGAPFGFYTALERIRDEWGYRGPLTMEPEGLGEGQWEDLKRAMASLR
jgi:sugar phosphate isomerase/epimerase